MGRGGGAGGNEVTTAHFRDGREKVRRVANLVTKEELFLSIVGSNQKK